ncbi:hypothetical protein [Rhodothalassium salexigens]|uniref:hypothetical protein n=1 Tax=Rhodothalassium salexigens TaxID=1086 RepID=UPI0019135065|nr:hypothetical protein [Rhodothalassium salexigens]
MTADGLGHEGHEVRVDEKADITKNTAMESTKPMMMRLGFTRIDSRIIQPKNDFWPPLGSRDGVDQPADKA